MSNILQFKPKSSVSARENLEAFYDFGRNQSAAFGVDLDYDSNSWDITEYLIHSGSRAARTGRVRLNFATRERDGSTPLLGDVTQFAKAFLRTRMSKYSSSALRHTIDAIRILNGVMLEHGVTETQEIDSTILTKTVETMRPLASPATVDARSLRLAMMAKFLDENGMSHYPIAGWKPPRYQKSTHGRVGKEFEERRNSKLPNAEVLSALAECFHLAREDRDVFVSSTTAIMCSAPERINEVLHLSADCTVEQQAKSGKPALGLRWPGSKGFSDHIKLVLPAMADVVRFAIQRLTTISEPARQMAKWYEQHPDQIYLPADLKHLRQKEYLELEEIGVILGLCLENRGNLRRWVKNENLPVTMTKRMPAGHSVMTVSFADFEQVILKRLPTGFPVMDAKTGLLFSDALMVVPEGTFHNGALASRCMFEPVRYHHITAALGNNSAARSQTIFSRVGLDPDRKMCIRSHQFRHWLNTLTQGENVSQIDIAKWSGRASAHQNAAYDHVSSEEIVIKIREAVGDHAKAIGPLAEIPKNLPVTRAEFAAMAVPTAHVTLYGFCIHDYTSTPCEMFRKCLDCREHVCIKGVPGKAERVQQALEAARNNLTNAQQAVADEVYGADEWVTTHQATVDHLEQLLAILTNPSIADGAVIQLSASNTYSLSEGALHDHMSLEGSCNLLLPNATPKALQ